MSIAPTYLQSDYREFAVMLLKEVCIPLRSSIDSVEAIAGSRPRRRLLVPSSRLLSSRLIALTTIARTRLHVCFVVIGSIISNL